jgi:hypothetical protein
MISLGSVVRFMGTNVPTQQNDVQRVMLESPYSGKDLQELTQNVEYARAATRDSLLRGEAPFTMHLLYPQSGILDDNIPEERSKGINAGQAWGKASDKSVFYMDRGFSTGMAYGALIAEKNQKPIEVRSLYGNPVPAANQLVVMAHAKLPTVVFSGRRLSVQV